MNLQIELEFCSKRHDIKPAIIQMNVQKKTGEEKRN